MKIKVEPVDYDSHPRFTGKGRCWTVDHLKLQQFTDHYSSFRSGGTCTIKTLLDDLQVIFEGLMEQVDSDIEIWFLEELQSDIASLMKGHANYFTRTASMLHEVRTETDHQLRLLREGFYVTSINDELRDKILGRSKAIVNQLRNNASSGKISREDLSVNSGQFIRFVIRKLNREFKRSGVLDSLRVLDKGPVRVVGLALELSIAGASWWRNPEEQQHPPKTLYAHVDKEFDRPKAIVYLSDVADSEGPITTYPGVYENLNINPLQDLIGRSLSSVGTAKQSKLQKMIQNKEQPLLDQRFANLFMKLPPCLRFNSHFGWDVISGSSLEEFVLSKEQTIVGPSGTTLVFAGARLLHRGGLVESGERLALQVVFGRSSPFNRICGVVSYVKRKIQRL